MVAVILAAGTGTRLRPLTDVIPKCLLEIRGRALLDRMLDALSAARLTRAVIVTGHLSDRIEAHLSAARPPLDVVLVPNPAYVRTNNAASLVAARLAIAGEPFVLCDGDVTFSESPFPALLAAPEPCTLAVDRGLPCDEEAMKVELGPDGLVRRISKHLSAAATAGESIGVQKVGGHALAALWDALDLVVARDPATAYYEDAFQQLIDRGEPFGASSVAPGTWAEIDEAADIAAAQRLF